MRTTIKDIANYTGFSVTTISLVLNNKAKKIPVKTRERIMDAARELNYHPNQLAVGLVKKRTETVGLILSDVSNVFFANLAKGVEDECRRKGWNLILCNTNDKHERDLSYIQVLADKGVDGILFCMSQDSDRRGARESIQMMKRLRLPFVMIDRFLAEAECCSVIVDHRQGGYLAARHLLELGHRRIGCVAGPFGLEDSAERLQGYQRALEEFGVPFREELIYEGWYGRKSGMEAVEPLLEQNVSAIFAFNDMAAYGAYSELRRRGLRVPEDISLVGYDDIFFSELLDVPLTTVRQPIYDMGQEAVKQLVEEVESKTASHKCITFQPELVRRDSTTQYGVQKKMSRREEL